MKLYTYHTNGTTTLGVGCGDRLLDLRAADRLLGGGQAPVPGDMRGLIEAGEPALERARAVHAAAAADPDRFAAALSSFADVTLAAPLPDPVAIWCSGLNYHSHIEENPSAKLLGDPRYFSKLPQCVIGPGEPIRHPGEQFQVDWEVEFAVVIGRSGYRLTKAEAMDHVFGYSILHDVSARLIQFKDSNEQMGKNFETFAPMGPCIVTRDEIPEPERCRLTLTVNGVLKQDFTNEDWCFPLPRMLEWLSMASRLHPTTVVTTGTGAGVGTFAKPPAFLKPGDVCDLTISGIGTLTNPVIADPYPYGLTGA